VREGGAVEGVGGTRRGGGFEGRASVGVRLRGRSEPERGGEEVPAGEPRERKLEKTDGAQFPPGRRGGFGQWSEGKC
jgi:hypothetical protein